MLPTREERGKDKLRKYIRIDSFKIEKRKTQSQAIKDTQRITHQRREQYNRRQAIMQNRTATRRQEINHAQSNHAENMSAQRSSDPRRN